MASERLVIPRLSTRSSLLWSLGTLLAVLVVAAYVFASQPENRWAVLASLPVVGLLVAFVVVRSAWVETETGRVVTRTLLGSRTAAIGDADTLQLITNRGGGLVLQVREKGSRRSTYLAILLLTDYVQRSQDPTILRALAAQVETWAPQRKSVVKQLLRQAEHLEQGGSAEDSPLAALVTHGVTRAAKAGGAAGGTSLLD
ncbi:MAG: hypothetical protein ABIN79_07750 [Marmoricola sp.]